MPHPRHLLILMRNYTSHPYVGKTPAEKWHGPWQVKFSNLVQEYPSVRHLGKLLHSLPPTNSNPKNKPFIVCQKDLLAAIKKFQQPENENP